MRTVTLAELRSRVVSAQGYAPRFRHARAGEVVGAVRRLACVQLDSISTVDRSHRIALSSRVGFYPPATVSRLLGQGRIFEFWAHEACLLPIEDFPMHRWRMERMRESGLWGRGTIGERPELAAQVLGAIRERGALGSRHFDGGGGGGMWNWKPAKEMLETLFAAGELVAAGRDGFQRLYDLPERVIPAEHFGRPAPSEAEFLRWATARAVEARGALTEAAIVEMWRLRGGTGRIRPHVDALVMEGGLERVAVEDGGAPVLVAGESEQGGATATVLLSPFDNLLWDRGYLERLFGFRHVIEVYKREQERVYGYYVLPLLRRDRLVGRADLKSDRAEGVLRLKAFHREPGVRASGALEEGLERALDRLARCLGLERVERLA
ncbi:MAG: winged helix-turn-helix domain-containing protein [Gaiellaceae bacterium]